MPIAGCAGQIFKEEAAQPSSALHHAAALASLLMHDPLAATVRLEHLVRTTPGEANLWNDLAAARHELAMQQDEPFRLPAALAAVDRALRLSPRNAEASFNRALILSQLGLLHAARKAWRDALAAERNPAWRQEIRVRLRELEAGDPPDFRRTLHDALAAAKTGNSEKLADLARERPQDLRMAGEARALNDWPEALLRDDHRSARQALADARLVAHAVCAGNGDCLLADVLQTIRRAKADRAQWRALVDAHCAYRAGRITYHRQLPDSDLQLERAAALFDRTGSPMATVARYYCANAMFDRNRPKSSRNLLLRVLRDVDAERHPTLAATAEKQLGLYYAFCGMWATSLLHLDRAQKIYLRAGETTNAAFVSAIVGEVCDRIGQFTAGWQRRRNALLILSRSAPPERLAAIITGAVHAEVMRSDYESALSLVHIATDHALATADPALQAETLLRKAHILLAVGSDADAAATLHEAENASSRVADPLTRSRIQADIWVIESEVVRRTDPLVAREIVTRAIAFYEARKFHMLLPRAYLERARASLVAGDDRLALEDLLRGLDEVEQQRTNIAADARATLFDTEPDLVAESVSILLAHGRTADAFAVVERARARTLTEALGLFTGSSAKGITLPSVVRTVPARTTILEYVLLPNDVAVFCIHPEGFSVVRLPVKPDALRDQVSALSTAMDRRDPVQRVNILLADLHRELIAPVAATLDAFESLLIVPDRFLAAIPFPALFDADRSRYLIEDYRITIAPSSTFALHRPGTRRLEPLLIVSDPLLDGDDPSLPGTRNEAAGIAQLYSEATVLTGPEATVERFLAAAPRSAVIHYAGHARSSESGGLLSLAVSSDHDGRIDAASIHRLRLPSTRLVVLAACETLRGSGDRIEGMPSVARAFLAAGVPTVVGTLWEVDDRNSSALFLRFHHFLRQGRSPATALRAAQCALLRGDDQRLRHPALWAAAEILGTD